MGLRRQVSRPSVTPLPRVRLSPMSPTSGLQPHGLARLDTEGGAYQAGDSRFLPAVQPPWSGKRRGGTDVSVGVRHHGGIERGATGSLSKPSGSSVGRRSPAVYSLTPPLNTSGSSPPSAAVIAVMLPRSRYSHTSMASTALGRPACSAPSTSRRSAKPASPSSPKWWSHSAAPGSRCATTVRGLAPVELTSSVTRRAAHSWAQSVKTVAAHPELSAPAGRYCIRYRSRGPPAHQT